MLDKKKKPLGGQTEEANSKNIDSTTIIDDNKAKIKGRTRNYGCIVYPESAPEGWQEKLADFKVPAFISPLHDKDIDPQKQPKKPHYHVMVMFEGVKSAEQVKGLFAQIGGVGCEVVNSIRGYARYLCHLDNPEKAQYQASDVRSLGGADYTGVIGLVSDKYKAIREMIQWCSDNNVFSYMELMDYCMLNNDGWFRVLCDNGSYVMKEYLKSKEWTYRTQYNNEIKGVDPDTGEVIEDIEDDDTVPFPPV